MKVGSGGVEEKGSGGEREKGRKGLKRELV
jgi:hypothetical protein